MTSQFPYIKFRAVIVFKGVMLEWVVVRGFVEDAPGARRNPAEGPDVWSESKFKVEKHSGCCQKCIFFIVMFFSGVP